MDIIQHSFIWNRCVNRLLLGKEQKMKCEDCCHAEMCKWIDELEGRGCDFYGGESISHKVIEDIKADIEAARYGLINDGLDAALRIIDKHIEGR